MKWKDACSASQDGKATRSTDEELWVIVDPDTFTISYDIKSFISTRTVHPNAATEVFKLVFGSEGIEYQKVRYAWMKEMDEHEDWEPRKPIPKAPELQTAGATEKKEVEEQDGPE